jgi:LPS export ABC transporter permease LptG
VRLLDRYVLSNFLRAYFYCIAAFFSIWLVFDISDNISVFLDERVSVRDIGQYYLTQIPQTFVVLLPVALLLALLFSLGRMSRTNEIVSMLTAGVSIVRLLVPLIGIGLLTAGLSAALNYALAPHAEYARKAFLEGIRGESRERGVMAQVFRNRAENRTWFIQVFRPEQDLFTTVQVLQQDEHDNIVKNYMATNASYHRDTGIWELRGVKVVSYDNNGNIIGETLNASLMAPEFTETPFRLASANMRAEYLSFPELRDYLRFNFDFPQSLLAPFATHMHYRVALPWTCLVVVFLGAPLAIGFSRKGVLTNVAVAIALVFSNIFLTHLFLALGEGDRIAPWAAAWTPDILFATVGLVLVYLRSGNRSLRSFNPFASRTVPLS